MGFCDGYESSSIHNNRAFLEQLNRYQLLKQDFALWNW